MQRNHFSKVFNIQEILKTSIMTSKGIFTLFAIVIMAISAGKTFAQRDLPVEERKVEHFNRISVAVPGNVYLVQGPEYRVIAEGTDRVLENLITEVKDGRLLIRTPSRWRFRRTDELNVYITMPELEGITLSGSATVRVEEPLQAQKLSVIISGSGRVYIAELDAGELDVTVSGSGRLNIGSGQKLERSKIVISGSGRIEAADLPVGMMEALISGSGSCRVHVLSDLNVRISGSGRIIYSGNPVIDARISGSGRVVNAR